MVAFRVDPKIRARVDMLAERANEGLLTAEERSEYEVLINAADVITILKLESRRHRASDDG